MTPSGMILVRSTSNCPNTPRIRFALEELALPYRLELVEDGTFAKEWGSPGPTITDGDVTTIEPGSILRHLGRRTGRLWPTSLVEQAALDRWFDFQGRRISAAMNNKDAEGTSRLLGFVERHLTGRTWFFDDFSLLDIFYSVLATPRGRAMLAEFPAITAFVERIEARPAYQRAKT